MTLSKGVAKSQDKHQPPLSFVFCLLVTPVLLSVAFCPFLSTFSSIRNPNHRNRKWVRFSVLQSRWASKNLMMCLKRPRKLPPLLPSLFSGFITFKIYNHKVLCLYFLMINVPVKLWFVRYCCYYCFSSVFIFWVCLFLYYDLWDQIQVLNFSFLHAAKPIVVIAIGWRICWHRSAQLTKSSSWMSSVRLLNLFGWSFVPVGVCVFDEILSFSYRFYTIKKQSLSMFWRWWIANSISIGTLDWARDSA